MRAILLSGALATVCSLLGTSLGAADVLQELVDVVRTIEGRLSQLEGKGHPHPTDQMELPNRQSK